MIEVAGVTRRYPGVVALDGVDFSVAPGEVHALVGENGAGKSTLMKILAGAERPDSGVIRVQGRAVADLDPIAARRLGIGIIHQELSLIPAMSVLDNLFLGREHVTPWKMLDRARMRAEARDLLARLETSVPLDAEVRGLSIAQQQMIEIARALSENCRVLIMDEPTGTLSEREVRTLFALIRALRGQGVSIVYISHRLEEIFELADRVSVMRDGKLVRTCAVGEVARDELIALMVGRPLGESSRQGGRQDAGGILQPKGGESARQGGRQDAGGILQPKGGESARKGGRQDAGGILQPKGGESYFSRGAHATGDPLFAARSLGGRFVAGVDLTVRRGEIVGLYGLVGAGRTSLLRLIFGADPVARGEMRLEGRPCRVRSPRDAVRAGIALVTEDRKGQGLLLGRSVRENVTLSSLGRFVRCGVLRRRDERAAAQRMVGDLRIKTPSVEQRVANLSGGNQQKVVVSRWLLTESRLLLFDEPTRGVDVGAKAEIYQLMDDLARQGRGIVMSSADLPEILAMSDRIVVMHEGRIAGELTRAEATPERILALAMAS